MDDFRCHMAWCTRRRVPPKASHPEAEVTEATDARNLLSDQEGHMRGYCQMTQSLPVAESPDPDQSETSENIREAVAYAGDVTG